MNPEEFVIQARQVLQESLTHLQTTTLLSSQLQQQILETGRSLQALNQLIDALSLPDRGNGQSASSDNEQPES